jgi:hypothetical protein
MAYLIAMGGHRLSLAREKMLFGSADSNTVPIPEAYGLTACHFVITPGASGAGYILESADPGAVVLVNGNHTQQCELRDQDTIGAGHLTAVFHAYEPMEPAVPTAETQNPVASAISAPVLQFGAQQTQQDAPTKKTKEKTGSAKGKMRGTLIGLACLGLVAGGGLAAQKTGVLDYALNSSPEDHFEFLSESVPGDFPIFVSGSLRRLISAYPEIAQSTNELPPIDVISKQMIQQIGIPLNAIDRITIGMDPTNSTYIGALSLVDDASLRSLKSHIKEKMPEGTSEVKFGNKITIIVDSPTGQRIAIHAPRGRHILFAHRGKPNHKRPKRQRHHLRCRLFGQRNERPPAIARVSGTQ